MGKKVLCVYGLGVWVGGFSVDRVPIVTTSQKKCKVLDCPVRDGANHHVFVFTVDERGGSRRGHGLRRVALVPGRLDGSGFFPLAAPAGSISKKKPSPGKTECPVDPVTQNGR